MEVLAEDTGSNDEESEEVQEEEPCRNHKHHEVAGQLVDLDFFVLEDQCKYRYDPHIFYHIQDCEQDGEELVEPLDLWVLGITQ